MKLPIIPSIGDASVATIDPCPSAWRGHHGVRFWAEPIDERFEKMGTHELYRVVCNLVNGLPPSYRSHVE